MVDPILIDAKACTQCRVRKSFADFSPSRYMRSGCVSECKRCASARQIERRKRLVARTSIAYPKEKRCNCCRQVHPKALFYTDHTFVDGLRSTCKPCFLAHRRRRKYGIDEAAWLVLCAKDICCAICAEAFVGTPNIDHCHATGVVRGLLCSSCNAALGHMRDAPERLRAAAVYLEERGV